MTDSSYPESDHSQSALEAACHALMTLRSVGARLSEHDRCLHVQVALAIVSLRRAIADLRLSLGADESMLALGFVLATVPATPGDDTTNFS